MTTFPYKFTRDNNGTFLITFPDIPEAAATAENRQDIPRKALEGLLCGLDGYLLLKRPIPVPVEKKSGNFVRLPVMETVKIMIYNEVLDQGITKAELARRLNVHVPQIDRMLSLRHNTKIAFLEKAAEQLGKRLDIRFL